MIHESDLAWRPVDSTAGLLTRVDDIVEKEAKKSLHADEPIHADDIRNIPLVRANDIVTGVWQSGGIRITGQFKAKGDGGLGDVITLVKLTGRDQVTARVTDVHEAEIVSADRAKSAARGANGGEPGDDASDPQGFAHRSPPAQMVKRPQPTANAVCAGGLCRATMNRNSFWGGTGNEEIAFDGRVFDFSAANGARRRPQRRTASAADGGRRRRAGRASADRHTGPTFMHRSRPLLIRDFAWSYIDTPKPHEDQSPRHHHRHGEGERVDECEVGL